MSQITEDRDELLTAIEPEEHACNLARVEAILSRLRSPITQTTN
jgi:hypothetical protein